MDIMQSSLEKRYLCITVGIPPKKHDTMTAYLEKNADGNTVKITDKKTPSNSCVSNSVCNDNRYVFVK